MTSSLPSIDRSLACRWLAILFLLFAALRAGLLISASPIIAYANQFDQARTADCAALWPIDNAGNAFSSATPSAPRSRFVRANLNTGSCLPSSAVAAANGAQALYALASYVGLDTRSETDIRYLGGLYGVVLAVLVLWNHRRLRTGRERCVHALAVLLLLADPFTTLFFNTLYTEAPAVIGFYAAVAILLRTRSPLTLTDLIVFVMALLVVGMARPGHFGLPLVLSALLVWRSFPIERASVSYLTAPLVAALAIAAWQLYFNSGHPSVRFANRYNAIMEALAPNARQPARFLDDLGLPASCQSLIGTNWFDRYGHDPIDECPTLGDVSAVRVAAVAVKYPESVFRALYRAQLHAAAWRLPYVGEVEGEHYGTAVQRWPIAGSSFADLWPRVPFWGRLAFYGIPVLLAMLALGRRRSPQALAFVTSGTTVIGVWTISILGDGYGELRRHVHLADLASLWSWGVLLLAVLRARDWVARVAWLAVPTFGALAGIAVAHTLPLALGYVERYDGSTARGWVIASLPMRQVRLLGHGAPVTLDDTDPSADVARYFALPDVTQARRWHADLTADNRCIPLALRVGFDVGVVNEIDALAFTLGPRNAIGTAQEPRCMQQVR